MVHDIWATCQNLLCPFYIVAKHIGYQAVSSAGTILGSYMAFNLFRQIVCRVDAGSRAGSLEKDYRFACFPG